ncbi:MAG: type transporter [Phenylobacterium sp.]|nr:type transporter [Phenylobacterium sp.]
MSEALLGLKVIQPGRRAQHVWDLLVELVRRDLKIRYKRSILGIGWSLLNPFLQLLIFTFVFGHILRLNIPHYPAFVFAGLIAWTWFSSALFSAPLAIAGNPELVRRPGFPVAALPVLTVASNAIPFVLALPVLFLFILADGGRLGLSVLALPLVVVVQFILTLGLACIVASSHVRFRDTQHLVGLAVMLGFYVTPVFYSARSMPEKYRLAFDLNPMAILLNAYRDVLIDNRWPSWAPLAAVLVAGLTLLAVGYAVFERTRASFAEEL